MKKPSLNGGLDFGGADGDRTHDLMNAIHALSQTELRPQNF